MKVAIIGLPKTGTTALYEAIKKGMPDDTLCVFEPKHSEEMEYLKEYAGGYVLTKVMFNKINQMSFEANDFDKIVLIVRDPRDYLVSSLLYRFDDIDINKNKEKYDKLYSLFERKEKEPKSISLISLFDAFSPKSKHNWQVHIDLYERVINYIQDNEKIFLLKYEDFVVSELNELSLYLGFDVKNDIELTGWTAKISRKKQSGDWKNWFTEADLTLKEKFGDVMDKLGYRDGWDINSDAVIEPKHCTQYIQKLVNARKSDPSRAHKEITADYIKNLTSAAKDGKNIAMTRLALLKLEGNDIEKDPMGAITLLEKASDLGNVRAMREMGKIISSGEYKGKYDFSKTAQSYFSNAVERDDPESCYHLARIYLTGNEVNKNENAAEKLLTKGANLGSKSCKKALHSGTSVSIISWFLKYFSTR